MPGEKRHWRLPTPFRRFSGAQGVRPKSKEGHSKSRRVSSVYLCDGTSTSDFIVVPQEFDCPRRTPAANEAPPAVTSCNRLSPNGIDSYLYDTEQIGFHHSSYQVGGSPCETSVPNTNWDDDLSERLGSAYERIHSMLYAASHKFSFSADPQMLRKQLGVPQHSVLNYPVHSSPDLPNPHTIPLEPTSSELPPTASIDVSHSRTSKTLGLCTNTNGRPTSPRCCPPGSLTATNSLSQRCAPGEHYSAHIACTPKAQPSISNVSKLVKRRFVKPIISSSSLSPFRRQALKGVLRKPVIDTPLPTNAHNLQTLLPEIRSPSPFNVDIVSLFTIRHFTRNEVTSSSPFITHGTTVE